MLSYRRLGIYMEEKYDHTVWISSEGFISNFETEKKIRFLFFACTFNTPVIMRACASSLRVVALPKAALWRRRMETMLAALTL
jgi:hypothetical protein